MAKEVIKLVQTTVKLPEGLHRQFKTYCVSQGDTMQNIVEKLIREHLAKVSETKKEN